MMDSPEHIETPVEKALSSGSIEDPYNAIIFTNRMDEISFLQKLQTNEKIGIIAWSPVRFARLNSLQNEKSSGIKEEQRKRFTELSRLQTIGGSAWTSDLKAEITNLYPLIENRK